MQIASAHEDVREWAERLEKRCQRENDVDHPTARRMVATKIKVSPGMLTSLARRRLKRVDAYLKASILGQVVRDMETELWALAHELEIHRRIGSRLDSDEVAEIETDIARLRKRLADAVK